ncbi:PP2C family protein-serine/threonine phosphatase [Umezawaea beigongshangensis]|uniref:PP2C family protein-serine/threonine phosphatase n=1 Tax=Umezawaea beigongshangensis TaxID=2780383 RepID=UPI0027DB81AF|nr:protein phosphatase 2C domain-containing protein [Umezawaea beigongshangensis]
MLNCAARSDRGLVRGNNEDSVFAGSRLLAVADGMGGHAAGEVASRVVISALAPLDQESGDDLLGSLDRAVLDGNREISRLVAADPDLEGMGTTLTALLFADDRIGLVNVGDSRTYLLRDGVLHRLTHDDTFVQSLVDAGRITPEEARRHPKRSMVLRVLMGQHPVETTTSELTAHPGDRYLLCSDGLSDVVDDDDLAVALGKGDPGGCADGLVELALERGGPDNVTVVVADVVAGS